MRERSFSSFLREKNTVKVGLRSIYCKQQTDVHFSQVYFWSEIILRNFTCLVLRMSISRTRTTYVQTPTYRANTCSQFTESIKTARSLRRLPGADAIFYICKMVILAKKSWNQFAWFLIKEVYLKLLDKKCLLHAALYCNVTCLRQKDTVDCSHTLIGIL